MNALQVVGWFGGELLAKVRENRTVATFEELVRSPKKIIDNAIETVKEDIDRVRRIGTPAVVVGGTAAVVTLPVVALAVPACMAARSANACESTMGAVIAGTAGFAAGTALMAYTSEIGLMYHLAEGIALGGKLGERAEKRLEKRKKQAIKAPKKRSPKSSATNGRKS